MSIAAKHLDPIVGIDMHMVQPPAPAPPVMMPIPYAGYLIDPNDYGSCKVRVNGFPPARAGTPGIACPPHIPPGGVFVKPPTNECEMYQGSSTVVFAGEAAAAQGHPVLSCHDVGMPAPARAWRAAPTKSLMMTAANVLPIPGASVVTIGGAPTITMSGSDSSNERQDESVLETIELEVYDAFGEPMADAKFELYLSNGDVEEGTLDEDGHVEVREVPRGFSVLVLPAFESSDYNPTPRRRAGAATTPDPKVASQPVGRASTPHSHVVEANETVRRIAWRFGIADWRSVFEHPANDELRSSRNSPNVLLAGDILNIDIPEARAVEYPIGRGAGVVVESGRLNSVCAEQVHLIRVRPLTSIGTTYANRPFTATVGSHTHHGTIDATGVVRVLAPIGARRIALRIKQRDEDDDADALALDLLVGALDPPETPSGMRQRLDALGYARGRSRRLHQSDLEDDIALFKKATGLEPGREADGPMIDKLVSEHEKPADTVR